MPLIRITSTAMTSEQRRAMVKRMTEVTMEVLGTPEESHVVMIDELSHDALGIGKKTIAGMIEDQKQQAAE